MKQYTLLIFILLAAVSLHAQIRSGVVTDDATKLPLAGVTVYNRANKEYYNSELNGAFAIKAAPGDTIIFFTHGYATVKRAIAAGDAADIGTVYLSPALHELEEVVIESPYRKYSQDSSDQRAIYHKTIKDAAQKPKLTGAGSESATVGVTFGGIFTSLANRVSGRTKKYRRFVKDMKTDEQARYISIKYNEEKVIALTHATDSMAVQFILRNPMPYDFARSASSLEISMWIRNHYREFITPAAHANAAN